MEMNLDNDVIKRRNFFHTGSFNMHSIEKLIKKIEKKFSIFFSYVTVRNTVNGKGLSRCSLNSLEKKVTVILTHKYTKNNKQAKIVFGVKRNISDSLLEAFFKEFSFWLKSES